MRSYTTYVDGQDVEGARWIYVLKASAFLRGSRPTFALKRALELGRDVESTEDVVGRCAVSTLDDNARALEAARRASREFRLMPQSVRSQIVLEWNQELTRRAEEMIEIFMAEGHPRRLAQWELSGMLRGTDEATIRWYESQLQQTFEQDGHRLELVRKPDGVVCVNPPQNAAGSNATMGIFSLLVGNTLVVKAPRSAPLGVMFIYREILVPILERHGAPPGTVNLICGNTAGILDSWIASPLVDAVVFFGDSAAGLKIGQDCLAAGKKAVLELAGNDGFIVWKDADLDAAARALEETFYGSSQICMVPKYAVVHPDVAEQFLEIFLDRVSRLAPGYPEDPEVLLSPVLKVDKFFDYLAEAKGRGAELLCGGERVDVEGETSTTGMFFQPTVVRVDGFELAATLSCVREETFFPMIPIVVPEDGSDDELLDAAIGFLNTNRYGLRNSIWTTDDAVARRFADDVVTGGQLKINDSHIGFVPILATHGGTGLTGGPYGELNYAGLHTSHLQGISWGDGDPRPLDPRTLVGEPAPVRESVGS
ncbi:MAG TPA: aldehyde dehydrogenase [Mycobacteriales bacterium]|nr:aldehyde dehydrogenase [Mycobacteriales bacterium]